MKIKNVYYSVFLFFAVLSLYSCSDVENKESYTGRTEGPATKLNVLRNGEAVGEAIQFSMGASSIILGVDCDGDWTAEVDEYDLAGFAVGVVDKPKILDPKSMQAGDVVIALPSSGVHSNGFSLVRKVFGVGTNDITKPATELSGKSVGEVLLTPTKIYVKPILALLDKVNVRAISHITGGGFYENIPRSLPAGLGAKIDKSALRILPIFDLIAKVGKIPERDMFNTFNMGVGMSVIVPKTEADLAVRTLIENGIDAYVIGEIVESDEGVIL